MMRGANLGNWLVLEKWMSPGLFAGTTAPDEHELCRQLDEPVRRERLRTHRDTWITQRDFVHLAARGLGLVRLPVPYFVFDAVESFVPCVEYVDRAMEWAHRTGIQVLLDLHTVPESANGWDNGGLQGVCKFHTRRENVDVALHVLGELARRYGGHPALWGIEVLNEPVSQEMWDMVRPQERFPPTDPARAEGSGPVPTSFLVDYYGEAYDTVRSHAPDVVVVLQDGFRMREWIDLLPRQPFRNVVVDTHLYFMEATLRNGRREIDFYERWAAEEFARTVADAAAHFPVMVGEWSLDTTSTTPEPGPARADYFRRSAVAQLAAFEGATAWTYWSCRVANDGHPAADVWDLGTAMDLGYLVVGD